MDSVMTEALETTMGAYSQICTNLKRLGKPSLCRLKWMSIF